MSYYKDEDYIKADRILSNGINTVEDIKDIVRGINAIKDDYEVAHGLEDALYTAVLEMIYTNKCPDPPAFAEAALRADKLEFPRYCA